MKIAYYSILLVSAVTVTVAAETATVAEQCIGICTMLFDDINYREACADAMRATTTGPSRPTPYQKCRESFGMAFDDACLVTCNGGGEVVKEGRELCMKHRSSSLKDWCLSSYDAGHASTVSLVEMYRPKLSPEVEAEIAAEKKVKELADALKAEDLAAAKVKAAVDVEVEAEAARIQAKADAEAAEENKVKEEVMEQEEAAAVEAAAMAAAAEVEVEAAPAAAAAAVAEPVVDQTPEQVD